MRMKRFVAIVLTAATCACTLPLAACGDKKPERSEYRIAAHYEEDGTLTGNVRFTYYNDTENELNSLAFNLWGNAYREGAAYRPVSDTYKTKAYYNGDSYGAMTVQNVEGCASWNVGGEDENILTVELDQPVYPQDRVELEIAYTLQLALVNHRTGVAEHAVNLGNFYPVLCHYTGAGFVQTPYYSCGDPFVSDCANYEVELSLPAAYKVASSGALAESSEKGGLSTLRYKLENARDFALVLSKEFTVTSRNVGGVQVNYYYYDNAAPDEALGAAADSVAYFSETFGSYAYPALSVVQTGLCAGGMEYPALTMISDEAAGADCAYTVVHETAHQWWYAMVGSDQINASWQDEGLAEYSALMFFENAPSYGVTRTGMVGAATKAYRAFYSVYSQIFGEADTSMNRPLSAFLSEYEYTNVAYNKGLLLFDTVRQSCGDAKFNTALKDYFKTYCFRVAPAEGLIAAFCRQGDLEGVFDSFIGGKIII